MEVGLADHPDKALVGFQEPSPHGCHFAAIEPHQLPFDACLLQRIPDRLELRFDGGEN